jgi:hypothetical protein
MTLRSQTQGIETDAEPASVVALIADGHRIPEWAPGFADRVDGDTDRGWRVTKGDNEFAVDIRVNQDAGTIDYVREISPGRTGGASLRAVPRLGGGTVIVVTLPVLPGAAPEDVAAILTEELDALARLVAP